MGAARLSGVPAGRCDSHGVTETLAGPGRGGAAGMGRRPSTVWSAFVAAATAALAGFAVTSSLVLLGWGLSSTHASAGDAVRVATQAWLLAHHGRLQLLLADVGLVPLGLTLLPGVLLYRAGTSLARLLDGAVATSAKALAALACSYAVLVVLGTGLADTAAVRVDPLATLLGAGGLAVGAGGVGLLASSELRRRLAGLLPAGARAAGRAAAVAVTVLVAAGAVLAGLALVLGHQRAVGVSRGLAPGLAEGAGLAVAGLLYVPNAALWATAYILGPGFDVGVGTAVGPFGGTLGPVPAFPLLAALPAGPGPPHGAPFVLVVPVLAGVLAGYVVGQRVSAGWRVAAGWAAAAGVLAGLGLAVLAALSGGPLGSGRMAHLGPSPWHVGLAGALELAVAGAATAAVIRRGATS